MIGEVLAETDLPKGAFSILPCSRAGADLFTTDDRLKLLSFTGSPAVGWDLKARAGRKKVVLELGGNAAVIVDADADLKDATERIVFGAFYQSGQSCIGVQRIIVHESIYDDLKDRLVAATQKLRSGDPKKESTFIGPMISESEAKRLESWVNEATSAGGKILCGGRRQGAMLEATLLEDVPRDQTICTEEAFGPVAVLSRFSSFDSALHEVNDSSFGLQAGIFTRDLYRMQQAWDTLDVGGVIIGDVPSWQGKRTLNSFHTKDLHQIVDIPSGHSTPHSDTFLVVLLLQQTDREAFQPRQVVCSQSIPYATFILTECNVEAPVQTVFDSPVPATRLRKTPNAQVQG
jgi:acyl-CoA reductase-like NAD-dependent aldehyde dehydrogenase